MKKRLALVLYFFAWAAYFAWFWAHALFFDAAGNVWAGLVNVWGDWAGHFTMATALAQRGVTIGSPFLLGAKFSYPFFADLISGWLLRAGILFIPAFTVPSFLGSMAIVFALFIFYKHLFSRRSLAITASLIFLFNGGVGAFFFARDIASSPHPLFTLINPPHEYTRLDTEHIKWISVIDSMIVPQRAFTIGFPVALFALAIVWWVVSAKKIKRKHIAAWIIAGLLIGTLPLLHTHSFIASFVILACWSIVDLWQHRDTLKQRAPLWIALAVSSAVVSLPLLHILVFGHVSVSFFKWYPGWLANEYQMNWLTFWFKNWGITPIMAGIGTYFLCQKYSRTAPYVTIPFFILFILLNLFLFQPYSWDNTKLLAWVSVGFSGLAAYALSTFFQKKQRIVAVVLFIIVVASGAVDAYWDLRTDLHSYQMYSAEELQMAQWARSHTDVHSVWLTSDQHNHWLYNLTGRQPVMAYRGWLWTQGYDYSQTEQDVMTMFAGTSDSVPLLKKYGVNYIVIGPSERTTMMANETFFATHYRLVMHTDTTDIYTVAP